MSKGINYENHFGKGANQIGASPLPSNIITLQSFRTDCSLELINFFGWLIVKTNAYKFEKFYCSTRQITEELHIKRNRIEKLIKFFEERELIVISKGRNNTKEFIVNSTELASKENLKLFYKDEVINIVDKAFFKDFRAKAKKASNKKAKSTSVTLFDKYSYVTQQAFFTLEQTYNTRRKMFADDNSEIKFARTQLVRSKKILSKLQMALSIYDNNIQTIDNAFTAYVDRQLSIKHEDEEGTSANDTLNYFLTISDGEMPVLNSSLEYFNNSYRISND